MRRTRRGRPRSAFSRGFQPDREPVPGCGLSLPGRLGRRGGGNAGVSSQPGDGNARGGNEGNGYIGLLEIPALGLSLPVMSEWSYQNLKLAPCRYSGSAYTGNFTIASHNYSTHFGPIGGLSAGDSITFTDMQGNRFAYEVQVVETLEATAVEDMVGEEWDLTLFTCDLSGESRITVRCLKV